MLSPKSIAPKGDLRLVEAPSRETEVRKALRLTKQLLSAGASLDTIGILVPNTDSYRTIIHTAVEEYSVPVKIELPLMEAPLVQDLVNLLQLAPEYNWRSTFQALRSPYLQQPWLTEEQIDQLDRLSREQPVLEGEDQWLSALRPIEEAIPELDDEDRGHPPFIASLSPEDIQELRDGLKAFFDHLSPPLSGTAQAYAWWIQTKLLGIFPDQEDGDKFEVISPSSLEICACCQNAPNAEHELNVLEHTLSALRELLDALYHTAKNETLDWENFCQKLIAIIQSKSIDQDPHQPKLTFAPLAAGRVRSFEHLIILGLSEGEFPSGPEINLFYI